jgi:hypothetical protein
MRIFEDIKAWILAIIYYHILFVYDKGSLVKGWDNTQVHGLPSLPEIQGGRCADVLWYVKHPPTKKILHLRPAKASNSSPLTRSERIPIGLLPFGEEPLSGCPGSNRTGSFRYPGKNC